jgi:hypothetical protein
VTAARDLASLPGSGDLSDLLGELSGIEDWLRDSCDVRHHERMADEVHRAWSILDDLYDIQYDREQRRR